MALIEIIKADITALHVDAIVNAANTSLLGGGGVDGAIHRAAGPQLLAACKKLGGCPTGQAKITPAYNLPAKFVIHTVGPVYKDGEHGEAQLLYNCYYNSLQLSNLNKIETIAFPCISTGVYRYPFAQACKLAIKAIKEFICQQNKLRKVYLVCFSEQDYFNYQNVYQKNV